MLVGGCPGVPVHEGIPIVFITIHGVMTQFVNVSFFCVPVHEDTTVSSSENTLVCFDMFRSLLCNQITSTHLENIY